MSLFGLDALSLESSIRFGRTLIRIQVQVALGTLLLQAPLPRGF